MINNMPKISMLSAAQIAHLRRMERKTVMSLGISNLIMVYVALSESLPEDSVTLLSWLCKSVRYPRNKTLLVVGEGLQRAEVLNNNNKKREGRISSRE